MSFGITGLPAETFAPLFALSDAALAERGALRRIADGTYPCRVSFADPRALYLHVHFAAPGCYAAKVTRA